MLVVSVEMEGYKVKCIFVDQGSSVEIMFWDIFRKLGLKEKELIHHKGNLIGFTGDTVTPKSYIKLTTTLGRREESQKGLVKFLVVDCPSAYHSIIGRPTLNTLQGVVSTIHLAMKFPSVRGSVIIVRGRRKDTKLC
jgi:hypothetical protein